MKYKIYELVQPDILQENVIEGYGMRSISRIVLEKISGIDYEFNEDHESMENAIAEIEKFKNQLKGMRLTIIPIIEIDYKGEIKQH